MGLVKLTQESLFEEVLGLLLFCLGVGILYFMLRASLVYERMKEQLKDDTKLKEYLSVSFSNSSVDVVTGASMCFALGLGHSRDDLEEGKSAEFKVH